MSDVGASACRIRKIQTRIPELNERMTEASTPEFSGRFAREPDKFDVKALRNLFAPLVKD
jgi:hypothetical protein